MNANEDSIQSLERTKSILHRAAAEVSGELGGAPVVVVVGGSSTHGIEATLAGWANLTEEREGRFRDASLPATSFPCGRREVTASTERTARASARS